MGSRAFPLSRRERGPGGEDRIAATDVWTNWRRVVMERLLAVGSLQLEHDDRLGWQIHGDLLARDARARERRRLDDRGPIERVVRVPRGRGQHAPRPARPLRTRDLPAHGPAAVRVEIGERDVNPALLIA